MIIGDIFDSFIVAIAKMRRMSLAKQTKNNLDNDFNDVSDTSITNTIANRFSTKVIGDSKIAIKWKVAIKQVESFLKRFQNNTFKNVINVSLGTGDCLIIPTFDGRKFGTRLVPNGSFVITEMSGEDIMGAWVLGGEYTADNGDYYCWKELHSVGTDESGVSFAMVERFAFKGSKDGKQIPLESYPGFKNMDEKELEVFRQTIVPNYDKPLFGRIKCPILNREDLNSPYGVPITYGNQKTVEDVKEAIRILNNEMKRVRTKIFFNKILGKKDENGRIILPQDEDFMIPVSAYGDQSASKLIESFAPTPRFEQYKQYIEFTMKLLESMIGISHDTMTEPADNSLVTATAIRVSMYESLALVDAIRKSAEIGIADLNDAVCALYNRIKKENEPLATGYSLSFDWDDSMRENSTEYFNMLLQSTSINATEKAELRSWLHNEPLEVARDRVAEIEAESEPIEDVAI